MRPHLPIATIVVALLLAGLGCSPDGALLPEIGITGQAIINPDPEQIPFEGLPAIGLVVTERNGNDQNCTGTLIAPQIVLTAGHCLFGGEGKDFTIHLSDEKSISRTIVASFIHPAYRELAEGVGDSGQDVAVLVLESAIDDDDVDPIAVMAAAPREGEDVRFVGYGVTDAAAATDPRLIGPVLKRTGTNSILAVQATDIFVAGATGDNSNVCFGDSGGPVLVKRNGKDVIAAVVSGGPDASCTRSLHTRVDLKSSWIASITEGFGVQFVGTVDRDRPDVDLLYPVVDANVSLEMLIALNADERIHYVEWFIDAEFAGVGTPVSESRNGLQLLSVNLSRFPDGGPLPESLLAARLGGHALTVVAADRSGNIVTKQLPILIELHRTLDRAVPDVNIIHPAETVAVGPTFRVAAEGEDNRAVSLMTIAHDGDLLGSRAADRVRAVVSMPPGNQELVISAYDLAGNARHVRSAVHVLARDTVDPEVEISQPEDDAIVDEAFSVIVSASDESALAEVVLRIDDADIETKEDEPFVFDVELRPGRHEIELLARDAGDNVSRDTATIAVRDTRSPGVRIEDPVAGATIDSPFTLSATVEDEGTVKYVELWAGDRRVGRTKGEGPLTFEVDLPAGEQILRVIAVDEGGNTSEAGLQVHVRNQVPADNLHSTDEISGRLETATGVGGGCSLVRSGPDLHTFWLLMLVTLRAVSLASRLVRRGQSRRPKRRLITME